MIEVSIPSVEKTEDQSGKTRKLFRVEILFNGRKHFVLRRHSDFHGLHRKLKRLLQTPDFPSRRNQLRSKPLEQRQQELEAYIQIVLSENEEVPQELLDFLEVKHFHSFREEQPSASQEYEYSCPPFQQRVVGFSCDPYCLASHSADLPDVVVTGVLQGLFPRDSRVSFKTCPKPSILSAPRHHSVPSIIIEQVGLSLLPELEVIGETGDVLYSTGQRFPAVEPLPLQV